MPDLTISPEYIAKHHVIVAAADSGILGMCAPEDHTTHWMLEHVWVVPQGQSRGIGRALVRAALDAANCSNSVSVRLLSDPFARGFYERLGAAVIGDVAAPMPDSPSRTLPLMEFSPQLPV